MTEEIQWFIGKEGTIRTRLDAPPFRAFFFWLQDDSVVDSADFDRQELEVEIEKQRVVGQHTAELVKALKGLA
jgi:hypothetical protein